MTSLSGPPDPPVEATAPEPRRRSVLVVDDDIDSVVSLSALLRAAFDAEVQVAADGLRALQMAAQLRPDVVLMDISMPGMDGFRAAQVLRSLMPDEQQPVLIAVTGLDLEANREAILRAGFDAALSKPLSMDSLAHLFARTPTR